MQILLWLVPPAAVTVLAMLWVAWIGRARPVGDDRSETARERSQRRFAEAIMREHPGLAGTTRRTGPRERSTGVVRTRRSA